MSRWGENGEYDHDWVRNLEAENAELRKDRETLEAQLVTKDEAFEELLEAAYWEMLARMDPTQTQYPTTGARYAFKLAVKNMLYKGAWLKEASDE